MSRRWLWLASLIPFAAAVGFARVDANLQQRPSAKPKPEAAFQTPSGFDIQGRPAVVPADAGGTLEVTVVERATGRPVFCRVNVIGSDGSFYEPESNPLAPWSLQRLGNRVGKGPFRYYGWFFYSDGSFSVRVPTGAVRIEVWKGFEYRPVSLSTSVAEGENRTVRVEIERTLDMANFGYHSGDTHIHLDRTKDQDDQRALDLMAAEDLRVGMILCMNDPRGYSGTMDRQIWPQTNGFGATSVRRRGRYAIASGQEYRCATYGHICLFMQRRLVLEGTTVDPNNWPVFGRVAQETRELGGYAFHAHGGYSKEIYADFAREATDGVELLQFAVYRGISLQGWYKMLSVGYRFPALGASDYPYCRALGDCRTYAQVDGDPTPQAWAKSAAEGKSFFTTGPMILLEVDGNQPGEVIARSSDGPKQVTATVRVRSEVAPVTTVELIVNGRAVDRLNVPSDVGQGNWLQLQRTIALDEPTWIAARAYGVDTNGNPNAEAHTNPIYCDLDGAKPYDAADMQWLLERVDERIAANRKRDFPEKEQVVAYFTAAKQRLLAIRRKREIDR